MSAIENIIGTEVVSQDGTKVKVASFSGKDKVVGLYFSAHWCPPCRGFTPELAKFYTAMKAKGGANGKTLEIVFISSDRDADAFKEYFGEMPWLGLDYSDRDLKTKLSETYGVRGIPTFILLDGETGEIVQKEGRGKVSGDMDGAAFPWSS